MEVLTYILPGHESKFSIKGRPLERFIQMPTTRYVDAPVVFELSTSDNVVRQVMDEGELVDVHMVTQIHTINTTDYSWHLIVRNGEVARYEDQLHAGQERLVNLSESEQFEDYQIGTSIGRIPN